MAWNPSPDVAAARDFGKKFKKQMVIIYHFDVENNLMGYTSFGETKEECARARKMADKMWNAVNDAYVDTSR